MPMIRIVITVKSTKWSNTRLIEIRMAITDDMRMNNKPRTDR